ncbi:hypothetical protein [Oribacterium sp. WCC10]|uniref:hypothetical protein n=1 Tax=Oribacterium sp. WCC10 TaxID=1855343 RepID=UPI0008E58FE6|nr:hypothetical protein [Oribacterium sp. WCC10]SFG25267.1 hypothetical protein SAMN05216356_10485 [Oribacterium sp. WCC10]
MKKLFYYTDVLPFLGRGEAAIDKLKRNMEIFREASDKIRVIWHPWSGTEEYLRLNASDVLEDYLDLVKNFREEGFGDLDESASFDEAKEVLFCCAGYYGDVSDLAYEAQKRNIPVMLQSIDI